MQDWKVTHGPRRAEMPPTATFSLHGQRKPVQMLPYCFLLFLFSGCPAQICVYDLASLHVLYLMISILANKMDQAQRSPHPQG